MIVDFGECEVFDVHRLRTFDSQFARGNFVRSALRNFGDECLVGIGRRGCGKHGRSRDRGYEESDGYSLNLSVTHGVLRSRKTACVV